MRCIIVLKRLNRYHDAELEPAAQAEIAAHLANCAACRAALERLEGVPEAWTATSPPPVPAGFAGRVMRQARERNQAQARARGQRAAWSLPAWWREQSPVMRTAAAAVVVTGLWVGGLLGMSSPSDQVRRPDGPENAMAANMALLSGAPHGSLEQCYVVLAFPAASKPPSP